MSPLRLRWYMRIVFVIAGAFGLAACGGAGGSSPGSDAATSSFEVNVCGAEVPEPTSGEQACSPLTITYEAPR
ncbi:MAG: hypothetical protein RI554_09660 [Trueperaceae bacterium]|nr:hypothetical protein [Trueperaceae bacterium]